MGPDSEVTPEPRRLEGGGEESCKRRRTGWVIRVGKVELEEVEEVEELEHLPTV
jgi:hypothetical protein